jgi:hypothetical protein
MTAVDLERDTKMPSFSILLIARIKKSSGKRNTLAFQLNLTCFKVYSKYKVPPLLYHIFFLYNTKKNIKMINERRLNLLFSLECKKETNEDK